MSWFILEQRMFSAESGAAKEFGNQRDWFVMTILPVHYPLPPDERSLGGL